MKRQHSRSQPPCSHRGPRPQGAQVTTRKSRDDTAAVGRHQRLRRLALDLWARLCIDWGLAGAGLATAIRQERWLGSNERRELSELLFGMTRQSRRLDFALEAGGVRLRPGGKRELARYLAYRLLVGEIDVAEATAAYPEVDWSRVANVEARITHEKSQTRRFALTYSLPDWLAARLLDEYGDAAATLAAALNERAPLFLRTNTLKITREALLLRLAADTVAAHATTLCAYGIRLEARPDVFGLAAYREGLCDVQDEGSQLVAELVAPRSQSTVVDACAGAGGKTLALAAAMSGQGRIYALDTDARKLEELKRRARVAGLSSVQALTTDATSWPGAIAALVGRVDRVLIDAPCTGTGALRRNPEIRWRLGEDDVTSFSAVQEQLLRRGMELLAPEGRIVYATCSLLREENENVVTRVLAGTRGFEIVPISVVLGKDRARSLADATGRFLKTSPSKHGCDGFFAAVLQRA